MTPHDLYRKQRIHGWTRADMLVEMYRAAIRNIDAAIQLMEAGDPAHSHLRQRAIRIVAELFCGLDISQGEIPVRIAQLCEYCSHCLADGDVTKLQSARKVLMTLCESFEGAREEAAALEKQGKIPPIDAIPTVAMHAEA